MRPPTVDLFLYAGEQDILDLRIATLRGIADRHIAVVPNRTFQGNPIQWDPPTIHPDDPVTIHPIDIDPWAIQTGSPRTDAWRREEHIRDLSTAPLGEFPDDTRVIMGDVDEIPHPDAIRWALGEDRGFVRLPVRYHQLAIDLATPWGWPSARWEHRQPLMRTVGTIDDGMPSHTGSTIRADQDTDVTAPYVGWHMSCMGGPYAVARKLRAYSHTEHSNITPEQVLQRTRQKMDLVGRCVLVDVPDQLLPAPVRERPTRWKHLRWERVSR